MNLSNALVHALVNQFTFALLLPKARYLVSLYGPSKLEDNCSVPSIPGLYRLFSYSKLCTRKKCLMSITVLQGSWKIYMECLGNEHNIRDHIHWY